jgi:hypothetical protein
MAEKMIRKVKKLTTFFSAVSFSSLAAMSGGLKIKCFNAIPRLMQISNINITTNQAIKVSIGFLHEG